MWKKVEDYTLNFHNAPRRFAIHLKLADGSAVMEHLTIDEFHTLGSLVHREELVWYHSTRGDLVAHTSPRDE